MPARQKIEFPGSSGTNLAGLLETPDSPPLATALIAHCFTCGKDIAAASRIARSLVKNGYAVMRFDFTGLGNSDGDFANTNFSSNVQDLIAAADYLREQDMPPSILIGHSLGGTAVLNAAEAIPESRGVVTIGSPADAQHVSNQFACDIDAINDQGEAKVNLAGRAFTIKKQFLDDINNTSVERITKMKKALLVSFVSLDNANHLLTRAQDAEYVANLISSWSSRFLTTDDEQRPPVAKGEISVSERDHKFTLDVFSDSHHWRADEPTKSGGNNTGPDPYEHLLAAVGSCTAMTVRMYASRKKWPLDEVQITLRHSREHLTDCETCDTSPTKLDVIERDISLVGDLSDEQRARLLEIADRCPVHKTLTGELEIRTTERTLVGAG